MFSGIGFRENLPFRDKGTFQSNRNYRSLQEDQKLNIEEYKTDDFVELESITEYPREDVRQGSVNVRHEDINDISGKETHFSFIAFKNRYFVKCRSR